MIIDDNSSPRAWRATFVAVTVAMGGIAGYQLGIQTVVYVLTSGADSSSYLGIYCDYMKSSSWAVGRTEALFVALGLLVSYLLSNALFNRLVVACGKLRTLSVAEKISIVVGVLLGLLMTFLISPLILAIQAPYAASLLILVGVATVYLTLGITTSMKDEFFGLLKKPGKAR